MTEPTPQGPEPTPPDAAPPHDAPGQRERGDLWWPAPTHPDVPRFTYSLPQEPGPQLRMPDPPPVPIATKDSRGGNRLAFAGVLLAIITSIAVVVAAFEVVPGRDVHRVLIPDDTHSTTASAGTSGSATQALDIQDAIVNITTTLDRGEAAGTGIVLTADGEVITNYHVIAGANTIEAVDIGNGKTYTAHVIGYSASEDIAILQLEGASGLATARIATPRSSKWATP